MLNGDKYEEEYEDWDNPVTCRLGKFTDRHVVLALIPQPYRMQRSLVNTK